MARPSGSDTNRAGLIPIRNVRVPDDLWDAAKAAAKANGEDVSKAVNRFLREYAGLTERV